MTAPIDLIRKTASAEAGRCHLEERFGPKPITAVAGVSLRKAASADRRLLRVAAWASGEHDTLELYELLGGTYAGTGG